MTPTDRSLTFAPFRVRSFRFQWPAGLLASWAFPVSVYCLAGLAFTLFISARWRASVWHA